MSVNASYAALLVLVVLAALEQLGIDTTSALAVFGVVGLAVGLAVKDSLANFASGVMIAFFEPFSLGHYVEAGGSSGTVVEVGMFNTILLTPDNKRVIVPNSVVYNGTIVNYSAEENRRVDLVFGIGYEDDYAKACELIRGNIEADLRFSTTRPPPSPCGNLRTAVSISMYGHGSRAMITGLYGPACWRKSRQPLMPTASRYHSRNRMYICTRLTDRHAKISAAKLRLSR